MATHILLMEVSEKEKCYFGAEYVYSKPIFHFESFAFEIIGKQAENMLVNTSAGEDAHIWKTIFGTLMQ